MICSQAQKVEISERVPSAWRREMARKENSRWGNEVGEQGNGGGGYCCHRDEGKPWPRKLESATFGRAIRREARLAIESRLLLPHGKRW